MTASAPLLGKTDRPRATATRRVWPIAAAAVAAIAVVVFLAMRAPAAAAVERNSVVIDTVTRGPFVVDISAAGTLVAEQPRLIAAPAAGRVESIDIEPGDQLQAGQLLLRLSNRETHRQLLEVEQQVAAGEADLADLRATLQARSLDSEKALRHTDFEKQDARRQAEASAQLAQEGLISGLESIRHREAALELDQRLVTERQRHQAVLRSADAQIAAQQNRVERLRALLAFHRSVVESLAVRAPSATTARDILVQEGEWVTEGQRLVRLVEPGRLKAVLQVPEAAAHELRVGQQVTMNARGTALRGVVHRLAAAVEQGTLAAEVRLEGEVPPSARPDLSIAGRISVDNLADALSIARSANAAPNSAAVLFKLDRDGKTARRTPVQFGVASADRIVVARGASAGERFIIAGAEGRTEQVIRVE